MSPGRVFETINGVVQEIDVERLTLTDAELSRQNARKHGLTAELEPKSVLEWYRVIVNDPEAEIPLLEQLNHMQQLALNLAQAEVQLRRVLIYLEEFERERDPLFEERGYLEHEIFLMKHQSRNRALDKQTRDTAKIVLRASIKDIRRNQRAIEKRARLLLRYKSEAQSKQRSAQKAWCDQFKTDKNPKSRNEISQPIEAK